MAAIAANWREYGNSRPELVREDPQFAALLGQEAGEKGRRKFYRWRNEVTNPTPPDTTRPHEGREVAAAELRTATETARLAAERHLPVPPQYLMRAGAEGAKNIDFLAGVHLIWADALRMREHALQPDESSPDGKRIEDVKLFDASIHRRIKVIEAALRVMQEIWDLDSQQRFYDEITRLIVDELAPVPDIQERVIKKLTELNNTRGMTIHAEVC